MLHRVWQNQHVRPTVYMGLGSANDPFTYGERAFCKASEAYSMEHGDRPLQTYELAQMLGGGSSQQD